MPQTREQMMAQTEDRAAIFKMAGELIEPLIEKHGIDDHRDGGAVFVPGTMVTKMDQHIDHIMRVADWLMIREE